MKYSVKSIGFFIFLLCVISLLSLSVFAISTVETDPPENLSVLPYYEGSNQLVGIEISYTDPQSFIDALSLKYENGNRLYHYKVIYRWKIDDNDWVLNDKGDYIPYSEELILANTFMLFGYNPNQSDSVTSEERYPDSLSEFIKTADGITYFDFSGHAVSVQAQYQICSLSDGFISYSEFSESLIFTPDDLLQKNQNKILDDSVFPTIKDFTLSGSANEGYHLTFKAIHPKEITNFITQYPTQLWYGIDIKIGDEDWQNVKCERFNQENANSEFVISLPSSYHNFISIPISIRMRYLQYQPQGQNLSLVKEGSWSATETYVSIKDREFDDSSKISENVSDNSTDVPSTPEHKLKVQPIALGSIIVILLAFVSVSIVIYFKKHGKKNKS